MGLIRPRLTDYHGVAVAQIDLDFAVPLLDADIPLYVDPFLLWKSPSQQDQALHTVLVNSFNHLNLLVQKGKEDEGVANLILASECDEVGLGTSASRTGKRLGEATARAVLDLYKKIPQYGRYGFTHFEEIQLYVDGISKDRVSDLACSFLKSFLVDYTIDQCQAVGIPTAPTTLSTLFDYKTQTFKRDQAVELPVQPENGRPILLVPKRWLRYVPWINFDDYFTAYCPKDDVVNHQGSDERVRVLTYNRDNYAREARDDPQVRQWWERVNKFKTALRKSKIEQLEQEISRSGYESRSMSWSNSGWHLYVLLRDAIRLGAPLSVQVELTESLLGTFPDDYIELEERLRLNLGKPGEWLARRLLNGDLFRARSTGLFPDDMQAGAVDRRSGVEKASELLFPRPKAGPEEAEDTHTVVSQPTRLGPRLGATLHVLEKAGEILLAADIPRALETINLARRIRDDAVVVEAAAGVSRVCFAS